MARKCQVTGKGPFKAMNVSFSHRRTQKTWGANIQKRRMFVPELGRFITVKISMNGLRTVSKLGLAGAMKANGRSLSDLT